jgi:hypothetical protein
MSLLALEGKRNQNPDLLNPKGSATRKSETSSSATTYLRGITQLEGHVNKKIYERAGHPPVYGSQNCFVARRATSD